MYFLDTNALYWYIGREKLEVGSDAKVDWNLLRSFLDNREDKALASSAYVEAMARFRNKPEYASKIHDFMYAKNLRLFNNVQYQTFSSDQISVNHSLKGDQLSHYIKSRILPVKIDIEVRFALGFMMSILLLYAKYRIDGSGKICSNHDYDIEMFIKNEIIEGTEAKLRIALEEAYNNHEGLEQQFFKEKYIKLLGDGCQLTDTLVELLSTKGIDTEADDIADVEEEVRNRYCSMKANNPDNYLMVNISKELCFRPDFKEEAKKRFSEMYSNKGKAFRGKEKFAFKDIQVEYLAEEMYTSWIDNSQKFRKNDIFDFFFLGCAEYKDDRLADNILIDTSTYLLSFDRKLDRYIERKRPANGKVLRKFYNDF